MKKLLVILLLLLLSCTKEIPISCWRCTVIKNSSKELLYDQVYCDEDELSIIGYTIDLHNKYRSYDVITNCKKQ